MKTLQVYECEHGCGYYKKTARSVENHEKRYFYNPETRSCATCLFLTGNYDLRCMNGIKFKEGKLRTQCDQYKIRPDDMEDALLLIDLHGVLSENKN